MATGRDKKKMTKTDNCGFLHPVKDERSYQGDRGEEQDREILDDLRPVNREGSYQGETKSIPITSIHFDSLLNTHSTVEGWRNVGKMKLNQPGRQKLR